MSKDIDVKKLGFKDKEEMLLYQDVCCEKSSISEPRTLEELLTELKSDEVSVENTKKYYEKYIKENDLQDLLNKVRNMPLYDRMLEIFVYYVNSYSVCKTLENHVKQKYDLLISDIEQKKQEAVELFDGEKEKEYSKQLRVIGLKRLNDLITVRTQRDKLYRKAEYILEEVLHRLPSADITRFYGAVSEAMKLLLPTDGEKNPKR